MVSSINQYGSTSSIWQQYATRQTETTTETEESDVFELDAESRPAPPPGPPPGQGSDEVTDSELDLISSILEEYEASALTEDDAIEIITKLEESDLELNKNVGKVLIENGFDPTKIKELATGETAFPPDSLEMRQAINNFKLSIDGNESSNVNSQSDMEA